MMDADDATPEANGSESREEFGGMKQKIQVPRPVALGFP
jgi:hypothetical protein